MNDPDFPPDSPVNWSPERIARLEGMLLGHREIAYLRIFALIETALGACSVPPSREDCASLYRMTMNWARQLGPMDGAAFAKAEARYRDLFGQEAP